MEIIGISGYARAGKDEAAHFLVEEYGFTQIAFADKLRDFLSAQNPIVGHTGIPVIVGNLPYYEEYTPYNTKNWLELPYKNDAPPINVRVNDVLNHVGWEGYKETQFGPEMRFQLQRLGTEAGRNVMWDTIWIDAAFKKFNEDDKVVISDPRFFNEFDAIRARGGVIWRVERPGVGPVSDHPSETEAPNYKFFRHTINNDGTLEDYKNKIRKLMV